MIITEPFTTDNLLIRFKYLFLSVIGYKEAEDDVVVQYKKIETVLSFTDQLQKVVEEEACVKKLEIITIHFCLVSHEEIHLAVEECPIFEHEQME